MSEQVGASAPASGTSAGRLLREAREKHGLHIAALAAAIKVAPKKLELLEADRFDALPDATFARALAQTVCRALKTDPAPVMRLLPPPTGHRLEAVGEGLNTPFRERPGVLVQSNWPEGIPTPGYWLAGLLLVGAIAVFFLPAGWIGAPGGTRPAATPTAAKVEPGMPPDLADSGRAAASGATAASAAASAAAPPSAGSSPAPAPMAVAADATTAPAAAAIAAAPASAAASATEADAPASGMVQLRATATSWVEVVDSRGQVLVSRTLKPAEAIGLDGVPPFRVKIGNAAATQLVFRGQATDLTAHTRDNVARLELR